MRDRLFRLRSLIAVGAAGLLIGGAAGAGGMALADRGDHGPGGRPRPIRQFGPERFGPGPLGPDQGSSGQGPSSPASGMEG